MYRVRLDLTATIVTGPSRTSVSSGPLGTENGVSLDERLEQKLTPEPSLDGRRVPCPRVLLRIRVEFHLWGPEVVSVTPPHRRRRPSRSNLTWGNSRSGLRVSPKRPYQHSDRTIRVDVRGPYSVDIPSPGPTSLLFLPLLGSWCLPGQGTY